MFWSIVEEIGSSGQWAGGGIAKQDDLQDLYCC